MKIETKQWRGLSEKKLKPLIILTYPYLVIWIIIPTVTNVPEPVLVPEADEPVHQYAGVEHPPGQKNVSRYEYFVTMVTSIRFHRIFQELLEAETAFSGGTSVIPELIKIYNYSITSYVPDDCYVSCKKELIWISEAVKTNL